MQRSLRVTRGPARTRSVFRGILFAILVTQLGCAIVQPEGNGKGKAGRGGTPLHVGFAVAGAGWRHPELVDIKDFKQSLKIIGEVGYTDAELTHRAGGNLIRTPVTIWEMHPHKLRSAIVDLQRPVYQQTIEERIRRLDRIDELLTSATVALDEEKTIDGQYLSWWKLDAFIAGVERFNLSLANPSEAVRVLLVLVEWPPRSIIEAPSDATLKRFGRNYTYADLWHRYVLFEIDMVRKLVRRYLSTPWPGRPGGEKPTPALAAVEIINEPDYHWIPDEVRVELSLNPDAYPMGKYITELYTSQIPAGGQSHEPFEKTPWGYKGQDMEWEDLHLKPMPIVEAQWGRKFDKYVRCLAQLHRHLSFAVADESASLGARVAVVSGSVTHNNIDYLMRMYRADSETFRYVDKIGIHPYHWPAHDIWRDDFVSTSKKHDWRTANPRDFAFSYFKRFDFLEEISSLSKLADEAKSFGLAGKPLWVTEFGIPTKKLGEANQGLENYHLFLYERGQPVPEAISKSIVWEDKWDAFFDQVDRAYLERHQVEAFLFYTLREGLQSETSDDEHSNFSLYRRDGNLRMDSNTGRRLHDFIRSLSLRPLK